MPRTYSVLLITNPNFKHPTIKNITDNKNTIGTVEGFKHAIHAAQSAKELADNYRQRGYSVQVDNKYPDIPFGYRPYLIYDYFGRLEGRPPGRNPNYRLVYKIVVVDELNHPVDRLFAEGVLKLK